MINAIRAHLAEFGIVAPVGRNGVDIVASIALANKIAQMTWAIMAKGEHYKEPVALAA